MEKTPLLEVKQAGIQFGGLKAVQNTYNWEKENEKLLALYSKLLEKGA